MEKTTNPYFKNYCTPSVVEDEAEFVPSKHIFSIFYSIPTFTEIYKNMKKFASGISKHTRRGKLDVDKAPCIEVCVNPKIKEKYSLTNKTPVDYADMLLPLTKNMQG